MKHAIVRFRDGSPPLPVEVEDRWDLYGLVVEDSEGREHHFGCDGWAGRPLLWVATYLPDGKRETMYSDDDLTDPIAAGHTISEPRLGPKLAPIVRIALENLADACKLIKFSGDTHKKVAVEYFQALWRHGREPYDAEEIYVFAATHGWGHRNARELAGLAEGTREGRWFMAPGYGRIGVAPHRAEAMLASWRDEAARQGRGAGP